MTTADRNAARDGGAAEPGDGTSDSAWLAPTVSMDNSTRAPSGETRTIVGEIVDAHCYIARGADALTEDHRACTARCLREGSPALIRETGTGQVYLAASPENRPLDGAALAASAAQRVAVTGDVMERDGFRLIEIHGIERAHEHGAAPHGGVVGMVGERHIEMVRMGDGEVRIYVLDDFMKPVSVADAGGSATIKAKDGSVRAARLAPSPDGAYLTVSDVRSGPDDDDITVAVKIASETLDMTLPFPEPGTEGSSAASGQDPHAGMHHHH